MSPEAESYGPSCTRIKCRLGHLITVPFFTFGIGISLQFEDFFKWILSLVSDPPSHFQYNSSFGCHYKLSGHFTYDSAVQTCTSHSGSHLMTLDPSWTPEEAKNHFDSAGLVPKSTKLLNILRFFLQEWTPVVGSFGQRKKTINSFLAMEKFSHLTLLCFPLTIQRIQYFIGPFRTFTPHLWVETAMQHV